MKHKRILVIDDDSDFTYAVRMILEGEGYVVEEARSGAEGLEKMRADTPDMVLMDVMMANPLDGYYTTQEIADDPKLRDVPILMVSSIADTPYASSFPTDQYLHIVEFVFKPIEPASLLSKIKGRLESRKQGMDIRKIYEYALQREHEGKRFFEQNAGRLSHAAAVGAFKGLAAEEQKHIEFIQSQLDALDKGKPSSTAMGVELAKAGFFSQRADAELLDQTVVEAMVPDLPVLRTAYLIERDFAEFYEMAAQKSEGEAHQVLAMLAQWERGHEALFKKIHDKAFEEYAQMPWGG